MLEIPKEEFFYVNIEHQPFNKEKKLFRIAGMKSEFQKRYT